MTELYEHVAAKSLREASADDAAETLIDILETLQEACDWCSSLEWSKEHMRKNFLDVRADLGYAVDLAVELRAFGTGESNG